MDEMFFKKMEEEGKNDKMIMDNETGGYSDVDMMYAKK
jgi:hypothetical protein